MGRPSAQPTRTARRERPDRRAPPVRFEYSNKGNRARRRPRDVVVADGDPRRGRVIGWYLCDQHVLPRLWVVVVVAGEHCVNGGSGSRGSRRRELRGSN